MNFFKTVTSLAASLASWRAAVAGEFVLETPRDYEVVQRATMEKGSIAISGRIEGEDEKGGKNLEGAVTVEVRLGVGKVPEWRPLEVHWDGAHFAAQLEAPAGGWFQIDVRAWREGKVVGEQSVGHVGVGEVFVVAGQSNSANYGEEKLRTETGRVAAFDGRRWVLSNDPQPGAAGSKGSFLPPLGDALVERFQVPVGFVACGVGGTSVREWLPRGVAFPNPPTVESRVERLPDGQWESKGGLYAPLIERMKLLGPHGFRAVLWHQGESDANQQDATRTLPGKLYREYLETIIRESRRESGWAAPWFVAQASYHSPQDVGSSEIREAQASLWSEGVALQGPDTDKLGSEWREAGGKGVHFNGAGLREHARRWAEVIAPWLERQKR